MSGVFGPAPPLALLTSEVEKAPIIQLREAVAPILANNILPHFTDHSVNHSDHVTQLVDYLAAPLQSSDRPLSRQESIVLYSACYLHDIGLHFENAEATAVIQQLELTPPWRDLDDNTRRNILRKYHHRISAEMVLTSARAERPLIGIQLTQHYNPSRIACLCEAHNLFLEVPADIERYATLTEDGPDIRMGLISGLLRMADILDESRRRALLDKARTLALSVESQSHWWRHYYTESVTFDPTERAITIWFDFPPSRLSEYSKVIPAIQIPWIETELERHRPIFNKYSVNWSLATRVASKQYSDTDIMPDDVMAHMLGQLRAQHIRDESSRRELVLNAFNEARPHISRRLDALRQKRDDVTPSAYLVELSKIADEMWHIGSKRSAVFALVFEYERYSEQLADAQRVEIGARLLEMILEDGTLLLARGWVARLADDARALKSGDPRMSRCLSMVAEWFARRYAYDQAVVAFQQAIECTDDECKCAGLRASLKELHFLQGELRSVSDDNS